MPFPMSSTGWLRRWKPTTRGIRKGIRRPRGRRAEGQPSSMERDAALVNLQERTAVQVHEIAQADILVGIPSFNNAATIGHVVKAAIAGLAKYFPDQRAVLVNADGGST